MARTASECPSGERSRVQPLCPRHGKGNRIGDDEAKRRDHGGRLDRVPEDPKIEAGGEELDVVADAQRRIANRLKRARGQLNAVIEAVESGADCRTVVTQLAAVSSALDRAGFAVISSAMRDCAADPEGAAGEDRLDFDEIEKLFLSLS